MMIPILIAATAGLIALWRLQYGVAVIILILPTYLIRTSIVGIPTTALELSVYAVTLVAIIDLIRNHRSFGWIQLPKGWWIFFFLWTVAWVIATMASTDRQASFGALKAWLIDVHVFAGLLLYTTRTAADRLRVVRALVISGVMVAIAGLTQLIIFRSTLQDGRLSSFFHPVANYAAMYLGPIFIIGLGFVLWKVLRGWTWLMAIGLIGLALLLTVSFAGYLATAVGAIFLWAWLPSSKLKKWSGWSIVILGLLVALILPQTKYFHEHFNTTDRSSGLVRTQIWVTSWHLIKAHPIVGIGSNTFEVNYRAEVPKHYWPPLEWLVAQPHNLYLALWLETGLLGLAAAIGFTMYWIRRVWVMASRVDGPDRGILLGALAAIIATLVHGLFDTPYLKNDLSLLFVVLIILPWLGQQDSVKHIEPEKQTPPR